MKTKKIEKKLTLQKSTIVQLDNVALETVKGAGLSEPPKCSKLLWCIE